MKYKKHRTRIVVSVLLMIIILFLVSGCANKDDTAESIDAVQTQNIKEDTTQTDEITAISDTSVEISAWETEPESETEIPEPSQTEPVSVEPTIFDIKSDFVKEMLNNGISLYSEKLEVDALFDKIPKGRDADLQSKIVPITENVNISPVDYFSDVIILGDSVSTGYDLYRDSIKVNGEAVFKKINVIAVISLGAYNATRPVTETSTHPRIDGKKVSAEDAIASYDAKKIFINLGLNDAIWQKVDDFIGYYKTLTDNIKAKNPDKKIYILSITPLTKDAEKDMWTNETITIFNNRLIEFAYENGYEFIDVAAALRDDDNALPKEFSWDNECHINANIYNRIAEYLLYHTVY